MATMRRDPMRNAASLILLGCLAALEAAQAQSQTHSVTPTLSVRMEHTDNVDGVSDVSATGKRSEDILTVAPALDIRHQGPNTVLEGRFGLLAEHRLQGTSSDRVVPDGRLRLRTEPGGRGAGLEASLQAQQVKPAVSSSGGTSAATANTVTETEASVSPFFERKLNDQHEVVARAQGLHARTDPRLDTSREVRTNSTNAQLAFIRRPSPFGYALEASSLDERQKAQTPGAAGGTSALREDGSTQQRTLRSTLLYAFGSELETGLILGSEKDRRRLNTASATSTSDIERNFDGGFWGLQATWRPGPRTEVKATVEDRKASRTWAFDASHRLRRTTFALTDRQLATRNAPLSASAMQGSMPAPTPVTSGAIANETTLPYSDQSTTLLSVQRTTGLRITYEGVRAALGLVAGQFRARALIASGAAPNTDRSRYHGAELSYRLTSQVTPSAGLRWSNAKDSSGLSRKEQLITMGLRVRLSPNSSLDAGAAQLSSRARTTSSTASEHTHTHSVYVRLEHRF